MGGGLLRQKRRDTVTEGKPGEKCRDCSDAATSQVAPGAPRNWKRQKGSYPGGKMALLHLDFGSLTSTTVRTELCCFKLVLCYGCPRKVTGLFPVASISSMPLPALVAS